MPGFTYDPALHVVSFNGILIPNGYGKDTFIKASRSTDGFTTLVGVAGEVVRSKMNDHSGEVELTLLAASQANDILSAFAQNDELTGVVTGPLMVQELNGTTVVRAAQAWIKKWPDMERAKEEGEVTWVFACASIQFFHGGLI